eukprot:Hpha_TRINITY_DN1842_c0_g1::TRINITY_DN1842_c0_g1_i1::g.170702::m.170702
MAAVTFDGANVCPIEPLSRAGRGQYPGMNKAECGTATVFLGCKREAETGNSKLWRIHEKFYDLESYMDSHPGGRTWMEFTRGTDCTEAFEAHHLDGVKAMKVLENYYVRDVKKGEFEYGNRFTYEVDGFYRSVRRAALAKLRADGPKGASTMELTGPTLTMKVVCCVVVLQYFVLLGWACLSGSFLVASMAGIALIGCWGVGHNFLHQADSKAGALRLAIDLAGHSTCDFRITHALSHHLVPNLPCDFEACFYVSDGNFGYTNPDNSVLEHWLLDAVQSGFAFTFDKTMATLKGQAPQQQSLLRLAGVLLPWLQLAAYIWTQGVLWGLTLFVVQTASTGLALSPTGLGIHNAALSSEEQKKTGKLTLQWREGQKGGVEDWGAHQVIAASDHSVLPLWLPDAIVHYLSLCCFGYLSDHILHHLFPCVDHSRFRQLRGVLVETAKQHNVPYRVHTFMEVVQGFHTYAVGRKILEKKA